tara:strand:+ start:809 stop:1042 length:234 start_codon:yes stop_codon:yes gene_type:complete
MFIQIAPRVKVYVTDDDMTFIQSHWKDSFRGSSLPTQDQDRVKKLADKAIFVRKKLDNDVQYALNRKIRMIRSAKEK